MFLYFALFLFTWNGVVFCDNNFTLDELVYKNVPEYGRLIFSEMARAIGLQCEEHTVTTEDGYKLTMFNIPGDKTKPLFIQHGVVDSADNFMVRGNTSIVAAMAKLKYDIWMGNQRGNKYSRGHVTLDVNNKQDQKQYWNYTLQELAVYDLPAMIDYVLNATGQTQLQTIGHSQGTTVFFILGAEKPEYNKKIKLFTALAPVCYLHHTRSLAKLLIGSWPLISYLLKLLGQHEIFPKLFLDFKTYLCSQKDIGYEICAKGIFFPLAGSDPEELEPEFFPTQIGCYPDSSSIKNGDHLVQIGLRRKFSKFDYGIIQNLKAYGSVMPPDYALEKVTMPIALIAAKNDNLSALEDVEILRGRLPNVVKYHVMEREQFNHLDHVVGKNMPTYLFPLLQELLETYN